MTKSVGVRVTSRTVLDKSTSTQVNIRALSMSERLISGLTWLGVCWGLGIVFVFIPMLHFILVPAALLIGMFVFAQRMSLKEYFESGTLDCPGCGKNWTPAVGAFGWPKREICPHCGIDIRVEVANPAQVGKT